MIYKKRYKDYADNIPYTPNINKFGNGGSEESKENKTFDIIESIGNVFTNNLQNYNRMQDLKKLVLYNDTMKLIELGQLNLSARNNMYNNMLENKQNNIYARLSLINYEQPLLEVDNTTLIPSSSLINQTIKPNLFAIGGLILMGLLLDSALGKTIGGDYHSGVTDAMSAIPGLGVVGGIGARLFGIKEDAAAKAKYEADLQNLNSNIMLAASAASLDDSSLNGGPAILNNVDVYQGGVFSGGKAAAKNAELQLTLLEQLNYQLATAENSILNILSNNLNNALTAYKAAGGALNKGYQEGKVYNINKDEYQLLIDNGYILEVLN